MSSHTPIPSKATPGPWVHYDDSHDGKTNRHEIVAMGKTVCRIYLSVPEEDAANARLIAAAPNLLAALKALVPIDFDEHPQEFAPEWHAARAAIAKATP